MVLKFSPVGAVVTAPDQLVDSMFVGVVMGNNRSIWLDCSRLRYDSIFFVTQTEIAVLARDLIAS